MRALSLLFLLPLLACGQPTESPEPSAPPPPAEPEKPAPVDLTSFDERANEILAEMTLAEKVGQMTQADISYIEDPADVGKYFLGSVLSGGSSDPEAGNSPENWREMVVGYHGQALETRLGIPLIYGIDAVHGHANVEGAVVFPHNIGLGATRDADLVEEISRATALAVRGTGIQWNFAPCVAVARDIRWGRTYEAFSEDPDLVAELGAAAVRGLQGEQLGGAESIIACAKHYLADGGTTFGTGAPMEDVPDSVFAESGRGDQMEQAERWPLDRGDAQIDEATLREIHLPGYLTALEEGVATIMPSFSSWNGERLSGHRYLLTEVLKEELGFQGFLISDWSALDDVAEDYSDAVEQSINAGMDMVMVPDRYEAFIETLTKLVEEERVPMERIDDAVRRILRVKLAYGLFEEGWSPDVDPALTEAIGGAEHRELARRAVAESLVVLRNDGDVLPLAATDLGRIHVVGRNADDLGNQCGGWTIQWQGSSGEITEGTTILEAIRNGAGDAEVTHAADGSGSDGADVVVAVVGETPYSEMLGDRWDLSLNEADVEAVKMAAASGAPVVLVVVSGRPLILGDVLDDVDAIVAAWLPGSEGDGVADVLFGEVGPTGLLPFTWPRTMEQLDAAGGQAEIEDPLFAFGDGLSW